MVGVSLNSHGMGFDWKKVICELWAWMEVNWVPFVGKRGLWLPTGVEDGDGDNQQPQLIVFLAASDMTNNHMDF